jgi:hypothetical protein
MTIAIRRAASRRSEYRTVVRRAGLLAVCMIVAACGVARDEIAGVPASGIAGMPEISAGPIASNAGATSESASDLGGARPVPRAKGAVPFDADAVVPELRGTALRYLVPAFGMPDVEHGVRAAWLWRYDKADCTLELLFFYDVTSDRYRLAMIRRDDREIDTSDALRCLSRPPHVWAQS